jgi:NAD(P)-dependent dehydrogenase (short-subunit alcohol dehydrogenase family)
MQEQGEGGSIINTASVAGLSGGSGPQAYSAAKAGVVNLSMSTAVELAKDRIRVNAICPGGIATPLVSMGQDPKVVEPHFETVQPLPIAGKPEHIAAAALFLASEDAAFVTGQALIVDGGLEANGPGLFQKQQVFGQITGVSRGTTGEEPVFRTD